jgi:hypothetical protein
MSAARPLTYREVAAKLRDLRRGRKELDKQIDALIGLLPKNPKEYDVEAKEWPRIEKALCRAAETVLAGVSHIMNQTRCLTFCITAQPLVPRKVAKKKP